ncbi:MAG: hypothetical protein WAN48_14455, partial [Actinomycetes bacterium]
VINGSGNKLDYYLGQGLDYEVLGCNADGSRNTQVTVKLTNHAPRKNLPLYVDQRLDLPSTPAGLPATRSGDNFVFAQIYGTQGAQLAGAKLDGKPVDVAPGRERGKAVFRVPVVVPAGQSVTITLELLEPPVPAGVDPTPRTFVSPLVKPITVHADNSGC